MKLLYIAPLPINLDKLGGVPKKIFCQLTALSSVFSCDLIYYHENKVRLYNFNQKSEKTIGNGENRFDVLKAANLLCKKKGYDAVYIRYPKSDLLFLKLCKTLQIKRIRFVVEIPTYPYDMEGNESIKGRIINIVDKLCRKRLKKYVKRIITYSKDEEIFGIKTIKTINGIDFSTIKADESEVNLNKCIYAIAVSAMYRVHGYDRFIKGIYEYYRNGGKRNIILKLVGAGDKYSEYKDLVSRLNIEDHVEFLGTLLGNELDNAYCGCAIGVNSLAIHRQGLTIESTLKTKEYAAKGLPIISSSYVDAYSDIGNGKYVFHIPADDTAVNIYDLIKYLDSIYSNVNVSQLRNAIRRDGQRICDIRITMKPVIEYLIMT